MKTKTLVSLICLWLVSLSAAAARSSPSDSKSQAPFNETGTLMEMQAVPCGFQERGFTGIGGLLATAGIEHVNSADKLCQEYVLRTAYVQYRIRPVNEKEPVLLPVGEKAHFHIKGDHIVLSTPEGDDKVREYKVVGMKPVTVDDESSSRSTGTKAESAKPISFRVSPTDNIPRLERRPGSPAATDSAAPNGGLTPHTNSTPASGVIPASGATTDRRDLVAPDWVAAGALTLAPNESRLTLDSTQLLALVAGGVSSHRIVMLLDLRDLGFRPEANYLANLRNAGATDELIKALNASGSAPANALHGAGDRIEPALTQGAQLAHASQFDQAEREYRKAQQVLPRNPSLHFVLGYLLAQQGKWKDSVTEYKALAADEPNDPAAHSNLAAALKQTGDLEGVIRECRRGLALDPDSAAMHADLAAALSKKGDLSEAVTESQRAILDRPQDPELHIELGTLLRQQKDLDGAIREDRQAVNLQAPCCRAQYELASALAQKGDLDGAADSFRKVLNSEPDNAQAHAGLAGVLERQGDSAQALAHYKMALLLDPQDDTIRTARDGLLKRIQAGSEEISQR